MIKLNYPDFNFRIRKDCNKYYIFDFIRKKFVKLTPEEWVRQHVLRYITEELKYPPLLISVEEGHKKQDRLFRTDIVVYKRDMSPAMIIECKSPEIKINQKTVDQAALYNTSKLAKFVALTNGLENIIIENDFINSTHKLLESYPSYTDLL